LSDPVPPKDGESNGQASSSLSASSLHILLAKESDIRKSPSTERKKKYALQKLLPSKHKNP